MILQTFLCLILIDAFNDVKDDSTQYSFYVDSFLCSVDVSKHLFLW